MLKYVLNLMVVWLLVLCLVRIPSKAMSQPPDSCAHLSNHTKVIITVSKSYILTSLNWFTFYFRLHCDMAAVHIICADQESSTFTSTHGLNCSSNIDNAQSDSNLWLNRVSLASFYLKQGINVVLSDTDALWLKDPFKTIRRYHPYILAGRATHPPDIAKRTGATLCMGFVYVQASPSTAALFRTLYLTMQQSKRGDDQHHFNHMLFSQGLTFGQSLVYKESYRPDVGRILMGGKEVRVVLLGHAQLPRHCKDSDQIKQQAIVAHCMHSRAGHFKEMAARKMGLWLLPGDINVNDKNYSSFSHFFATITLPS